MAACQGAMTNAVELPSPEEIKVPQELTLPYNVFKAGAYQLGKYCDHHMKEFMLCRNETSDPRKCLKEGADLTACGVDFFHQVKQLCRQEFEDYLYCTEMQTYGHSGFLRWCRKPQRVWDACALNKIGVDRPDVGYFSVPRVHESDRPRPPPPKVRDYKAEAAELMNELPEDYPIEKEYKRYASGFSGTFYN